MWITRQKAERIVQKCIIIILAGYKSNLPFNTAYSIAHLLFLTFSVKIFIEDFNREECFYGRQLRKKYLQASHGNDGAL